MADVYDFTAEAIDGTAVSLEAFRGRVLLIVNVASQCGFTPQYEGLERLYRTYRDAGLVVLGFPCDQFGHQEPGPDADIERFCADVYAVSFPMFRKIEVNGAGAHPLFRFLARERRGLFGSAAIKWNFTKFLIDRHGRVLGRYGSAKTPAALEPDIVRALELPHD